MLCAMGDEIQLATPGAAVWRFSVTCWLYSQNQNLRCCEGQEQAGPQVRLCGEQYKASLSNVMQCALAETAQYEHILQYVSCRAGSVLSLQHTGCHCQYSIQGATVITAYRVPLSLQHTGCHCHHSIQGANVITAYRVPMSLQHTGCQCQWHATLFCT
jgi:hypothetical protein